MEKAGLPYRAVRGLMIAALHAYYREISIEGAARIPADSPLLITANHPNSILDALTLGVVCPRPVHFLAKATLFVPGAKQILNALGAIPVHRKQDDPSQMNKNKDTFAAAHSVLRGGGVIGIFPEGVSHAEPRLKAIKSGFARIALEAEAGEAFPLGTGPALASLGVKIVPVGIHKGELAKFRGKLAIRVGEPIAVHDYFGQYQDDQKAGIDALVDELEKRLRAQILHLGDDEVAGVAADAHDLLSAVQIAQRGGARGFALEVAAKQDLGTALAALKARDPEAWAALGARLATYRRELTAAKLLNSDLAQAFDSRLSRRAVLARAIVIVLISPFALVGLIVNYPAYWLTGKMAPVLSRAQDVFDTSRVLFGLILFGAEAALTAWLIHAKLGRPLWQAALGAGAVLACGLLTMIFISNLKRAGRLLRLALMGTFERPRFIRLRRMRARLVDELETVSRA